MDVLSASKNDDKIAWYPNDGSGNFGTQQVITTAANGARSVYASDLDGDGDMDVLSASENDDKIAWYPNDGSGNFGPQYVISGIADGARSVYAADLDGDGDMDVLSASTDVSIFGSPYDSIEWYANDGLGNFSFQPIIDQGMSIIGAVSVYATDLDGDGDMDVLSASRDDDKIAWYPNDGSGNFGTQQVITTAADSAYDVYATDLDGDGDMDVLSASGNDDKIAWYPNDGSGNFGPQQVITTAADTAYSVYATDIDGDGDMDVLSASASDDKIAWYENQLVTPVTSTATQFGTGCGTPSMVFTPTSTAILGQPLTSEVTNAPSPFCLVAFGTSNTVLPGIGALPLDLTFLGMTGCTLYQSNDRFGLQTSPGGSPSQRSFSVTVPSNPQLLGKNAYFQAFCLAPGVNPRGIISSNAIDFLIGNQ